MTTHLVRALRVGSGRREELQLAVGRWNVVPDREAGLEQEPWPCRVRHLYAVDLDADVP